MSVRTVQVVDYRAEWPQMFQREHRRVWDAVGDIIVRFEHIGSTSVPKLAAKPVIDMMPAVLSLEDFDASGAIQRIEALGYEYRPHYEDLMPFRRYFALLDPTNTEHPRGNRYQIHLTVLDNTFWRDHLLFRDYLRQHPDEAARYAAHKRDLAPNFTVTRDYADAKAPFIQAMLQRARTWQTKTAHSEE